MIGTRLDGYTVESELGAGGMGRVYLARDDAGGTGVLTRIGTVNLEGNELTVLVPPMAASGNLAIVGADTTHEFQTVPRIRGVGGTPTPGIGPDGTFP